MTKIAPGLLFSLLLAASPAQASLITNGSFEAGSPPPPLGGWQTFSTGSTAITGWTVIGGNIDWVDANVWQASDGTSSLDLIGNAHAGGVEQTIATVAGQRYLLTFDLAGNPDNQALAMKYLDVSAGAATQTFSFDVTGHTLASIGWTQQSLSFVATGSTTTISFLAQTSTGCCWGPALDNVAVNAVPEPESDILVLTGLGLAGMLGWRRRAVQRRDSGKA